MAILPSSAQIVSFGVFTADLRSGELYKNGIKVRLERQPFQVLSMLLETPGELVSREELRNRLWPQDTFVDFDHALNTTVTKIRVAVGDDADNPRFVETVPRRGYRFVAPVNGVTGRVPTADHNGPALKSAWSTRKIMVVAIMGILAVLAGLSAFWLMSPVPAPKVLKYTQLTSDGQYKDSLFTDGSRLYFTVAKSGRLTLAQISTAGGQVTPVSVPFEQVGLSTSLLMLPRCSSMTTQLFKMTIPRRRTCFRCRPELRDVLGIALFQKRLGRPMDAGLPTDGARTYMSRGRMAAHLESWQRCQALHSRRAGHRMENYCAFLYGSGWGITHFGKSRVTAATCINFFLVGTIRRPSAAGSGRQMEDIFIFMSSRGDATKGESATNLWAVREKDEYFRRVNHKPVQLTLTSTGTAEISSAVPSRDGKRLFVISGNERYELVRYDKVSRNFLPYLPGVNAVKFSFSRDGLRVVYVNFADNTLWRSRVDGSERLQLTFPPMNANFIPSWSPDGSQIAFPAILPGRPLQIFRISRDGGTPERLTEGKHRDGDARPSWSPDGKILVFGEYLGEFPDSGAPAKTSPMHVWLLDLQSRKLTTLPGSADLFRPAWSPDGRYISAYSTAGSLLVFDFATQKWTEIVKPPNEWCTWSHDGKYIQCGSVVKGEEVWQRVRVTDHKVETVTSLKNLARIGFNGINTWLGAAPDDSPLAIRDVSSFDIYAIDWELP